MQFKDIICGRYEPSIPHINKNNKITRLYREKPSDLETVRIRRKLARKFPSKSSLDKYFLNDPHLHVEEVFKLKPDFEECIQLDMSSMYPWALIKSRFPHPKRLKYFEDNPLNKVINSTIQQGIFCCTLTLKPELDEKTKAWFSKYHYLRYAQNEKCHHFYWKKELRIKTILHSYDIQSLHKYCDIKINWSIRDTVDEGIYHPLKFEIQKWCEIKDSTTGKEKQEAKLKLVSLCSTQKKKIQTSKENMIKLWEDIYGKTNKKSWVDYNNVCIVDKTIKTANPSTIYCLYSQIQSYARNQIFLLQEIAFKHKLEPIRTHTDGIIFDSKKCNTKPFIQDVKKEFKLGSKCGELKAYIAQKCFFLGPNTGWIYDEKPTFKLYEHVGTSPQDPFNTELIDQEGIIYPEWIFFDFKNVFKKVGNNYHFLRREPCNWRNSSKKEKTKSINIKMKLLKQFQKSVV